jgi:PIN domain nuclease of toxin-antitoxin system
VRILLDTHVLLWWQTDDPRLSKKARTIIADPANRLVWSIASSWEIAVKIGIGKLRAAAPLSTLYSDIVSEFGAELLPITHAHCCRLATLPLHHRDPFDRMIVAQAQSEELPILSADPKLAMYGVETVN